MRKWIWGIVGFVFAILLGLFAYQSLFGNNDEALEVKKQPVPIVHLANVNAKEHKMVVQINNSGGTMGPLPNGEFHIFMKPVVHGNLISDIPSALLEKPPLIGQKIWVTITPDDKTFNHKVTAASYTPPTELKDTQIVLIGEYLNIAPMSVDNKRMYEVKYGMFDDAKQTISNFLFFKGKSEIKEMIACYKDQLAGKESDTCLFKLWSIIDATLTVDPNGQIKSMELAKNPDAGFFPDLYPGNYGLNDANTTE